MEERKRPAAYDAEDVTPPLKKHASSNLNGSAKRHDEADLPGKDELERFQKEAIYRQMQEYKREKATLESRLNDLIKRTTYHDDHLRALDGWFGQLLDDIALRTSAPTALSQYSAFPSSLLSAEPAILEKHLKSRSGAISTALKQLFAGEQPPEPHVADLQARLSQLLLSEKNHLATLEKTRLEKEQLEERLEMASMRYMVAEKKLDRAKSLTVAKLERQAIASGRVEAATTSSDGSSKAELPNGQAASNEALAELDTARKAAVAETDKQREQLDQVAAENEKLTAQLTAMTNRLSHLSDEDYARTDLFKYLRSQHEDVIKRINDLEATNVELRNEAEKLQAERTAYQAKLDAESQAAIMEKEQQLAKAENDIARIRTTRDELSADLTIRQTAQEAERASMAQLKQLAAAKADRISALESEVERIQLSTPGDGATAATDVGALPVDELRTRHLNLDRQYAMLNQELASMGTAFKKASSAANLKITNQAMLEDKVNRLGAEKARADQKYFAAMKAKDAREQEVRTLRAQNSKSSDIVSQLKDAEAATRALAMSLEKQLAEAKEALAGLTKKMRAVQQQVTEKNVLNDGLKAQVDELKTSLATKDASLSGVSAAHRKTEVEVASLKTEVEDLKSRLESWQSKGVGHDDEHHEALRNLAICTVCRKNFKNTAIKTCGHVFCQDCVEERLQSRMRKCPNCNKAFGASDHMRITL